jgi:hypothetical protein
MPIKYFYIDDDPESQNKVAGFENAELSIVAMQHEDSWENQFGLLKEKEDDFNGLILDLKLDDKPNGNNKRANFRGTSLAQEIRTRQKEGVLKSFPIVLFSTNEKTEQALEKSGKDLFDIFIDKQLDDKAFTMFTTQLIDLPIGYNVLSDSAMTINNILKVDETIIDSRFVYEYDETKKSPVHIQSRFLITELLSKQGLLIDEDVLAARLGIDKSKSTDWPKLLELLTDAKYKGVFCNGWPRWWMHLIEKWWKEEINSNLYLRSTPAGERVEEIKQTTELPQLVVAEKIDKADSDEFWTICKGHGLPLDPVDGLLIQGQDNLYSWQEPEYVSIDAALWRKNIDNWIDVADVEKERYAELKSLYSRKRQ